jgi:hypothetical protein
MRVEKKDTVRADIDAQFEVGECFRLRRLRHDGSNNSQAFERRRRIK